MQAQKSVLDFLNLNFRYDRELQKTAKEQEKQQTLEEMKAKFLCTPSKKPHEEDDEECEEPVRFEIKL